jgi:hypothetical protein
MEPRRFFLRGEIDVANADGLITTLRGAAGQASLTHRRSSLGLLQLLALTYLLRPIPAAADSGVSGTGDLLDARHE